MRCTSPYYAVRTTLSRHCWWHERVITLSVHHQHNTCAGVCVCVQHEFAPRRHVGEGQTLVHTHAHIKLVCLAQSCGESFRIIISGHIGNYLMCSDKRKDNEMRAAPHSSYFMRARSIFPYDRIGAIYSTNKNTNLALFQQRWCGSAQLSVRARLACMCVLCPPEFAIEKKYPQVLCIRTRARASCACRSFVTEKMQNSVPKEKKREKNQCHHTSTCLHHAVFHRSRRRRRRAIASLSSSSPPPHLHIKCILCACTTAIHMTS